MACASAGSQLYAQPRTDVMGGRRSASARTAVDLAVPRWPMMSTPPTEGAMTFSRSASFISSCPTIAVKGKAGRMPGVFVVELFAGRPAITREKFSGGEIFATFATTFAFFAVKRISLTAKDAKKARRSQRD